MAETLVDRAWRPRWELRHRRQVEAHTRHALPETAPQRQDFRGLLHHVIDRLSH
jgi:hypothetical protein